MHLRRRLTVPRDSRIQKECKVQVASCRAVRIGPPTIALKGLVHNPDKIGRSKVPRADFIRTKWPKIGGRGGRKIRTYGPRVSDV